MNPQEPRESCAITIHLASATKVQERLLTARHIPAWKTSFAPRGVRQNDFSQRRLRGVGRGYLLRRERAARTLPDAPKLLARVSGRPTARICQLSRPSMHTAGRE